MLRADEFAILPWSWAPADREALADIRDCGFNLAGFLKPEHLDLASQAGLQCIVSDASIHAGDAEAALPEDEIARRVDAVAERTANHPATFGYYLRDEPSAAIFPGLAKWAAAVTKAAPQALPYINLFPNYATAQQLGAATYQEHLDAFVATVKPRFISYDHYALMDDGSLRESYFANLEAVRATAQRSNLPFWNIVLSNAHFHYAEPTDAGLRFQLYTTLAYGARGISYFTYFAPTSGNYRLAPIDQFGNKTATWDRLRLVNLQLHKLGPTYVTLKSVNVFHHPNVPTGSAGLESSRHVAEVKGDDLLVGEFDGPRGEAFALIVNKSVHHSTWFRAKFRKAGAIHQVNAYTGAAQPWAGENNWLAAGQGMLLFIH
jgi:hypothetical protein